jgi:ABC-type phosphate transport system substrate-binding protein
MKTIKKAIYVMVLSIVAFSAKAQNTISIKSEKLTSPLVAKWVAEYRNINPGLNVEESGKNNLNPDIELIITDRSDSLLQGKEVFYVVKYALLPVVSKNHTYIDNLEKERFNKKKLRDIFFEKDFLSEEDNKPSKLAEKFTVYSGNKKESGATVFASYFGHSVNDLRGKKIAGDDMFLLNAINKDNTGLTFNSLSYLYDLSTRQLKPEIKLLPLDLKKEYREILESATLDEVLALIETGDIDLIPVQNIGFVINKERNTKPEVGEFIKWVLTEGQKYNHDYGFLLLNKDVLLAQTQQLGSKYLSLNNK